MPDRKHVRNKQLALQNIWALQTAAATFCGPSVSHKSDASIFVGVEVFSFLGYIRARSQLSPSGSVSLFVWCRCFKVTWPTAVPSSLSSERHYSLWASLLTVLGCGPGWFPNIGFVRLQFDLTLCDSVWMGSGSECEGSSLCLTFWKQRGYEVTLKHVQYFHLCALICFGICLERTGQRSRGT